MSSKTFACRSWRIILGRSANTEAPCHSRCGTIKIPPCSNAVGVGHRTQICSNSMTRVTSPYEWRLHMSARFSSGTLKTKRPPPPHFPWFKWLGGGGSWWIDYFFNRVNNTYPLKFENQKICRGLHGNKCFVWLNSKLMLPAHLQPYCKLTH